VEYDSKEAEQHKYNLALSKQLYTEIHNKILKLEKPQLIQVMLTVAKALTDRTVEVHHKNEMDFYCPISQERQGTKRSSMRKVIR